MDSDALFSAFLDGRRLTEDDRERLSRWVVSDPSAADRVVQTTIVHEWLADRMSFLQLLDDLSTLRDPGLKVDVTSALGRFIVASESVAATTTRPVVPRPVRRLPRASVAGGAAIAAAILAGFFVFRGGDDPSPAGANPPERVALSPPAEVPPTPPTARLVESIGAELAATGAVGGARPAAVGEAVGPGERVELVRGVAQWRSAAGHVLVAEAPAALRWLSPTRVELEAGRVVGRAAEGPDALVVTTATADVIDLGTEFGVAQEAGLTRVSVYDGEVELVAVDAKDSPSVRVPKGFRGGASAGGLGAEGVVPIRFDREFVRPDEVLARRRAAEGSAEAEADVRWFELQRVPGVLAYQGFDAQSEGAARTIGCAPWSIERGASSRWALDLGEAAAVWSRSIEPAPGDPAVLLLDTSPGSRVAAAGLIDDWGTIGRPGKEVWLSWLTRAPGPDASDSYAGLALLYGPKRVKNEPLFFGRPDGSRVTGLHRHFGPPIVPLRGAEGGPAGRWVARFRFGEAEGRVSVWLGVAPPDLATTPPQAEVAYPDMRFDRFGVGAGERAAPWRFDEVLLTDSAESLAAALAVLGRPSASSPPEGGVDGARGGEL